MGRLVQQPAPPYRHRRYPAPRAPDQPPRSTPAPTGGWSQRIEPPSIPEGFTGRVAARSQFAQSRRQHRRDAYANYLAAVYDRDVALDAMRDMLRGDRTDLREVDEKMERFDAQVRSVHRAAEFVILEGPQSVVEALYRALHEADDLAEVMRRMVCDAHAGDTSRKAADTALASEREHLLYQAVKGLRAAAADVLGDSRMRVS